MPRFAIVLPVKPPARGKSRLLPGLTDEQRHDLAVAFAHDTAAACLSAASVDAVLVVTDDAGLAAGLVAAGCAAVPDAGDGLNGALRQGAAEVRRRWPDLLPVALLADLPALRPVDLDAALGALVPGGPSYVVDAAGTGTTLYTASHEEFDPAFGPDSAHAHQVAGALPIAGELTSLRRDVDDLDDLRDALALGVGPATATAAADLT